MAVLPITKADRILIVMAHPDDLDFGLGGSAAKWVDQGSAVKLLLVTSGDAGGFEEGIDRSEMASIREEEQRQAASHYGFADFEFLRYPDGRVEATYELRAQISRVIREYRPDRLVCQSPERNYQRLPASHPDHRASGDAALNAVYPDARNPFAHPELKAAGLEAYSVPEVLLIGHPDANAYEDVTATFDRKISAILSHRSQLPDPSRMKAMVGEWLRRGAESAGLPEGSYAEVFYQLKFA